MTNDTAEEICRDLAECPRCNKPVSHKEVRDTMHGRPYGDWRRTYSCGFCGADHDVITNLAIAQRRARELMGAT